MRVHFFQPPQATHFISIQTTFIMATLLDLMNASIECNNLGVVLLEAGDLDNALDSFLTAARLMHPVSKQVQRVSPSMEIDNDGAGINSGFVIPAGIQRIVQESADLIDANGKHEAHNIFISAKPVRIELAQQLPEACTLESAVVVYNMALCYHLRGSTECLDRAVCLYDMAFQLCATYVTNPSAATVAMGSLNNAGEIYHSFGHYQYSRRYLDTLRFYILKLPLAVDTHTMEERHKFLLNAVLLQPPMSASAA